MSGPITFLATFPGIQTAIKIAGDGGARIQLDIPESEMANAVGLLAIRDKVLKVTIEVESPCFTGENRQNGQQNKFQAKPGQSGNPNGRPPKSRALTDLLQKALNKTIEVNGKKRGRKYIIAENVAQAIATGRCEMPDGSVLQLSPKDWMEFTKWMYGHIDGPPRQELELSGPDGTPILITAIEVIPPSAEDDGAE